MHKKVLAIIYALLAAVLYTINIPFSKLLLKTVPPTMLASYLYLGAGIGIGIISLFTNKKKQLDNEKITKNDILYVAGMIILDIFAPIFLMFGLLDTASTNASLLNNFEIVCTSIIALMIFKEKISLKMWIAIILITLSSFVLSIDDLKTFSFSYGALLVLLATFCWGMENNCTKKLANKNTYHIVFLKGIFSGLGSLIVAIFMNEQFVAFKYFALTLLLGFIAYGLSIFFYIKSQGIIGAAKTSAYYSVAPFVGTFLSFIIFEEKITINYFFGLIIMIIGTVIVIIDTLKNEEIQKM